MGKTIMVIDDSDSFRTLAKLSLERAGYDVVEASDGRDALDKLALQRVNLIVCDVTMPNMDGLSLLRHVKESPMHRFTPMIMLTTETLKAKKDEGRAAGAKAWITKPFQPSQLVEAVNRLCG